MLEELDHAFHQLVLLHVAAANLLHREPKSPLGIVDDVAVKQIAVALDLLLMSRDVSDAAVDFALVSRVNRRVCIRTLRFCRSANDVLMCFGSSLSC
jgi:hypothetical protein